MNYNCKVNTKRSYSRLEDLTQAQKDKIIRSWMETQNMLGMESSVIDLTVPSSEYDPAWDEVVQPHYGVIGEHSDLSRSQFLPNPASTGGPFSTFTSLSLGDQYEACRDYVIPNPKDGETEEEFDARVESELLARAPGVKKLEKSEEVLDLYRSSSQDTDSTDDTYDPMDVDEYTFSSSEGYENSSSDSIFIEY